MNVGQLLILSVEVVVVATVVLGAYGLKDRFGLGLLMMMLGAFQFLQTALALSIYVEVAPGLLVSPGSVVLFPASLFAVLLVYVRSGVAATQQLIHGIVAVNLVLVGLVSMFGVHLSDPLVQNRVGLPPEMFAMNPRLVVVGTVALYLDVLFVAITYETLRFLQTTLARTFLTFALVLAFDTLLFTTGAFIETDFFLDALVSGLIAKTLAGFLYAVVLTAFLGWQGRALRSDLDIFELIRVLSWPRPAEALPEQVIRDPETGLFNQAFFADVLPREVQRADHLGRPVYLVLLELFGDGDAERARLALAGAVEHDDSTADLRFRLNPDRFALVLTVKSRTQARGAAEAIRLGALRRFRGVEPAITDMLVAGGIATFPTDGRDAGSLMEAAELRLARSVADGADEVRSVG